jgi:prophage regulatory protein
MEAQAQRQMRVLRLKQVQDRIGLSRSTIYDRLNVSSPRYDKTFPKPMKLGCSAVGWLEESVDVWIQSRANDSKF